MSNTTGKSTIRVRETAIFIRSTTLHSVVSPHEILLMNLEFVREDDEWRGECLELGVATCSAPSIEQSREELNDMTLLYLNENDRMGQLKETLEGKQVARYPIQLPPNREEDTLFHIPGILT